MFGKKTKVSVQDGRMTIMTDDARTPGVVSLMIDQVRNGSFETATAENDGHALVFKPQGRKTVDTIAVYNSSDKASKAMKAVFDALRRKSQSGGGFWRGLFKVLLILVLLLGVLFLAGSWALNSIVNDIVPTLTDETAATQPVTEDTTLPVGEPFPAEKFIDATQSTPE